jgi:hypothetical protein
VPIDKPVEFTLNDFKEKSMEPLNLSQRPKLDVKAAIRAGLLNASSILALSPVDVECHSCDPSGC